VFFLQLAQVFAVKTQLERIKTLQTESEQGGETNFTLKSLDIEFHNVKFSYGDKQVFDHLNFTVKEGTVTAFTGKSGSGKTTTAKLGPVHTTWNQRSNGDNTQGKMDKSGKHQVQLVIPGRYPPEAL
jgi:ABC-type transport system involved in cytochrome bd biosynthesis fused ATPase/permease subunit